MTRRMMLGLAAIALLLACEKNDGQRRTSPTTTTGADITVAPADPFTGLVKPPPGPAEELERQGVVGDDAHELAIALCERQLVCDRIGAGRAWTSVAQCVAQGREAARVALDRLGCESGLRDERLRECEVAVRAESCAQAQLDLTDRVVECARVTLCAP